MRRGIIPVVAMILAGPGAAAAQDRPAPGFALPPADTFDALVKRPLFDPARRSPPDAARDGGATPTGSLRLVGIAGDGGRTVALLRDDSTGRQFRLLEGDLIEGWRIDGLRDGKLIISGKAGPRTLSPGAVLPPRP